MGSQWLSMLLQNIYSTLFTINQLQHHSTRHFNTLRVDPAIVLG